MRWNLKSPLISEQANQLLAVWLDLKQDQFPLRFVVLQFLTVCAFLLFSCIFHSRTLNKKWSTLCIWTHSLSFTFCMLVWLWITGGRNSWYFWIPHPNVNDANQLRLRLLVYAHQYSMIWYSLFQLGCLLLAITLAKCVLCWSISPRESIGYITVGYLTCRINLNLNYYQNCKEIQTLMLCSYLAEWIIASCYCLLPGCCVQIVS